MLSFLNLFFNNCRKKLQILDLRGWSPFFLDLVLLLHKASYIPLSETLAHNVQDPEFFSTSCITRLLRLEFQMFRDFLHYITKEKIKFREGGKMQTVVKQRKIFQAFSQHFFLNVDNKCQQLIYHDMIIHLLLFQSILQK